MDTEGDTRAYVVCAEPRSGSNLLCEALQKSGAAGNPDEYLDLTCLHRRLSHVGLRTLAARPGNLTSADWLEYWRVLVRDTSTAGLFGLKVHRHQYELARRGNMPGLWETLSSLATGVRAVILTRDDKVQQAVSTHIAAQTGRYFYCPGSPPAERISLSVAYWHGLDVPGPALVDGQPVFDFNEIDRIIARIQADELAWRTEVEQLGIPYVGVTYEALTSRRDSTIARVCRFLRVPIPKPFKPSFQRQSIHINDEFAERYRRERHERHPSH